MQARPVLMLTHDDLLWQHWKRLSPASWLPARGNSWGDLERWRVQQRRLVVIDAGLPDMQGTHTAAWRAATGATDILVASLKVSDEEGRHFLSSGAKGYIHAYLPPETLDTALRVVANGGVWLGASLLARLLRQLERGARPVGDEPEWVRSLTPREKEVAERAALGLANQAIAEELGITERTVRAHISSVFEKLGVSDRLMLALVVHGISA